MRTAKNLNEFNLFGKVLVEPYKVGLFKLHEDFTVIWKSPKYGTIKITVKAGFITDMGSVPRVLRRIFPYIGNQYLAACYLVHDALYATQGHAHRHSQEFVDELLYLMIKEMPTGVSTWKAWCIFKAVDWFGDSAWKSFDENDRDAIKKNQLKIQWGDK